jgi:predicted Fe-Mo cluster-binding NifX family protein
MKVAFTTSGDSLESPLDSRFGRAPKILVYDLDTKTFEITDNIQNLNAAQGAGIQAAQNVARAGASHLVTGHCGPKAFKVLKAAGIAIYTTDAGTVSEALDRFRSGSLTPAQSADVEGHWT